MEVSKISVEPLDEQPENNIVTQKVTQKTLLNQVQKRNLNADEELIGRVS